MAHISKIYTVCNQQSNTRHEELKFYCWSRTKTTMKYNSNSHHRTNNEITKTILTNSSGAPVELASKDMLIRMHFTYILICMCFYMHMNQFLSQRSNNPSGGLAIIPGVVALIGIVEMVLAIVAASYCCCCSSFGRPKNVRHL